MVSVLGYQKLYKDKKQKQEGDVIVKENVKVITSDMDKKKKPINVNDDNLVFESNPKYKEGDVIVAGEISGAENGFIRKVVSVKKATGGYVVETQAPDGTFTASEERDVVKILKSFKVAE